MKHEDIECGAYRANSNFSRHERGDRHQHCCHTETAGSIDSEEVCGAWRERWKLEGVCDAVSNMQEKMEDPEFTNDLQSLLRPGIKFNASDAYPLIYKTFIDKMEGKRD